MQRIGGSLGVAILVTIYGTVMKHTHPPPGLGATAQAAHVLTRGIAAAFAGASAFAALALLVTLAAVAGPRPPNK